MADLVALLDPPAAAAVRRTLPPGAPALVRAASPAALVRLLDRRPIEALITDAHHLDPAGLAALRQAWPQLPVIVAVTPRADDGPVLQRWRSAGVTALLVHGVDDAIAGRVLLRHAWVTARWRAVAAQAKALRCETPLQSLIWRQLLAAAEALPALPLLAAEQGMARETLSRQFGAGDAPTLKRAADAARVLFASQLLANPACPIPAAARLLGFAGPAHLRTAALRVTGAQGGGGAGAAPRGCFRPFFAAMCARVEVRHSCFLV